MGIEKKNPYLLCLSAKSAAAEEAKEKKRRKSVTGLIVGSI